MTRRVLRANCTKFAAVRAPQFWYAAATKSPNVNPVFFFSLIFISNKIIAEDVSSLWPLTHGFVRGLRPVNHIVANGTVDFLEQKSCPSLAGQCNCGFKSAGAIAKPLAGKRCGRTRLQESFMHRSEIKFLRDADGRVIRTLRQYTSRFRKLLMQGGRIGATFSSCDAGGEGLKLRLGLDAFYGVANVFATGLGGTTI